MQETSGQLLETSRNAPFHIKGGRSLNFPPFQCLASLERDKKWQPHEEPSVISCGQSDCCNGNSVKHIYYTAEGLWQRPQSITDDGAKWE